MNSGEKFSLHCGKGMFKFKKRDYFWDKMQGKIMAKRRERRIPPGTTTMPGHGGKEIKIVRATRTFIQPGADGKPKVFFEEQRTFLDPAGKVLGSPTRSGRSRRAEDWETHGLKKPGKLVDLKEFYYWVKVLGKGRQPKNG